MTDLEVQNILNMMRMNDKILENILNEFKEIIPYVITGKVNLNVLEKSNNFAELISIAALKKMDKAIAFSCFINHTDLMARYLPIPLSEMSEMAIKYFVEILSKFGHQGLSKSVIRYLKNEENIFYIKRQAEQGNKFFQYLLGFINGYKFLEIQNFEKSLYWYEKAALNNCILAIEVVALYYDSNFTYLPTDLLKSAYWNRKGALAGNMRCAYNLGTMYCEGDGVVLNRQQAQLWLSYAYENTKDKNLKRMINEYCEDRFILLKENVNLLEDIELNPILSEFIYIERSYNE